MSFNKSDFLKRVSVAPPTPITIDEWGLTAYLKKPNLGDTLSIRAFSETNPDETAIALLYGLSIMLIDEDGQPVLSLDELCNISPNDPGVLTLMSKFTDHLQDHSSDTSVDDALKNS